MKNNKISELGRISERLEEIVKDYSSIIGGWPSESEQALLQQLQAIKNTIKEQHHLLEEYEKISLDDIIDFRVDIREK